ncbi:TPA: ATPase, partial [Candidatus Delongbacteria bacterium]|nr:ATPase [Candidatus Delongbacteria bacterium]
PITVLQTLTKAQLQLLFEKNIVVCSQILNNIESLDFLRLTPTRQNKLLEEIKSICNK